MNRITGEETALEATTTTVDHSLPCDAAVTRDTGCLYSRSICITTVIELLAMPKRRFALVIILKFKAHKNNRDDMFFVNCVFENDIFLRIRNVINNCNNMFFVKYVFENVMYILLYHLYQPSY